jgi:protein-tyrosine kinase
VEGVVQALKRVHGNAGAQLISEPVTIQAATVAPAVQDNEIVRRIVASSTLRLDRQTLFSNNIVSFQSGSEETRPYDVLRNLVLDDLADAGSRTIAVTSPTVGCGATVTAANLAFSIARLRKTKVLLLDCNQSTPGIAEALGMSHLLDNSAGADGDPYLSAVDVDGVELYVGSLALLGKRHRAGIDQDGAAAFTQLKQQLGPLTIVMDLPPMLSGDQTLPLILGADMVLLVLAVGLSTVTDLEACKTYLSESDRVQVVLNKSRKHGL